MSFSTNVSLVVEFGGEVFQTSAWSSHSPNNPLAHIPFDSRKRPRRVLSKKALSLNIVIKHCLKFCWSDGCLERLSSNIAQSSTEVMAVFKDCHQTSPKVLLKWWLSSNIAQSSAEVMAVFKDCHQTSPKVLLKWWLSLKIVIKHRPKFYWSDGCLQTSPKVLLKWWLSERLEKRLLKVLLKCWLSEIQEKRTAEKRLLIKIVWKSVKIYSFSVWGAGIAPVDLTTLSSLRACRTLKTVVKCEFLSSPIDPFVTSDASDVQNCGKTQIFNRARRPFRHFRRVGRSKLW